MAYYKTEDIICNVGEYFETINTNKYYAISNHGRIMSLRSCKILRHTKTKYGYTVRLVGDKSAVSCKIHYLLAVQFIERENEKHYMVEHIDGDNLNNDIDNLRWTYRIKNSTNRIPKYILTYFNN